MSTSQSYINYIALYVAGNNLCLAPWDNHYEKGLHLQYKLTLNIKRLKHFIYYKVRNKDKFNFWTLVILSLFIIYNYIKLAMICDVPDILRVFNIYSPLTLYYLIKFYHLDLSVYLVYYTDNQHSFYTSKITIKMFIEMVLKTDFKLSKKFCWVKSPPKCS